MGMPVLLSPSKKIYTMATKFETITGLFRAIINRQLFAMGVDDEFVLHPKTQAPPDLNSAPAQHP